MSTQLLRNMMKLNSIRIILSLGRSIQPRPPLLPGIASCRQFTCSSFHLYRYKQQVAMVSPLNVSDENSDEDAVPMIGICTEGVSATPGSRTELQSMLQSDFNTEEVEAMVDTYPELLFDLEFVRGTVEIVTENLAVDNVLKRNIILNHPWILLLNHHYLRARIDRLNEVCDENNVKMDIFPVDTFGPLFILATKRSEMSVHKWSEEYLALKAAQRMDSEFKERLKYFTEQFSISHLRAVEYFQIHPNLFTYSNKRIKQVTRILTIDAKIRSEDILQDLNIYRTSQESILARLQALRKIKLKPIKVWMLRCEDYIIHATIKLWKQKKIIFGATCSPVEYLSKTLRVSPETVVKMSQSNPLLLSTRPNKLKRMTEFLFSIGSTPRDIMEYPRIYQKAHPTLEGRVKLLQNQGYTGYEKRLRLLGAASKRFQENYSHDFSRCKVIRKSKLLDELFREAKS